MKTSKRKYSFTEVVMFAVILVALVFIASPVVFAAETRVQINDRVNEIYWNTFDTCFENAAQTLDEFDNKACRIITVNVPDYIKNKSRRYEMRPVLFHSMVYCMDDGLVYDNNALLYGPEPIEDVIRAYSFSRAK